LRIAEDDIRLNRGSKKDCVCLGLFEGYLASFSKHAAMPQPLVYSYFMLYSRCPRSNDVQQIASKLGAILAIYPPQCWCIVGIDMHGSDRR
jgi:hypothetical protein